MRAPAVCLLAFTLACGSDPVDLSSENATIEHGDYLIINNQWGKTLAVGRHSQFIFLRETEEEVRFGWDWSWLGTGVVAYPNVFYGDSPFDATRTTDQLPILLGSRRIVAQFDVVTEATGTWNTSFDLFTTATAGGPKLGEIMIWTDGEGMQPAGEIVGELEVGGTIFDLFWDPEMDLSEYGWPQPFPYAAYRAREPVRSGPLDIGAFIDDLLQRGYVPSDGYLACIGLGNEVVLGSGHTEIAGYAIEIE